MATIARFVTIVIGAGVLVACGGHGGTGQSTPPPNTPVISSLEIRPTDPTSADKLVASYTATDPNNEPLTFEFEWRRNGIAIAGQTSQISSSLPPGNFVKGDVIELILTASDTRSTATATARATILNGPPAIANATLSPDAPVTTDDLSFGATATDPDGDPLDLTYGWRRNGVVIAGETGSVLPAAAQQRGDVITAVLTASDGDLAVTVESPPVTIQDAPPVVTVAGAPTSVAHGGLVTFDATVSDPDGDPTGQNEFRLLYGPAGMTVDAQTGAVTWTAGGPMFGTSMDVNWAIGVDNPVARTASGTITVTDPTRRYPLMRTGIEIPLWPAGLRVGDFDGDGNEEMLILSNRSLYELKSDGAGGYRQSWMYPFSFFVPSDPYPSTATSYYPNTAASGTALATGDVDGDGKQEIFVAARETIVKLDGVQRRVAATTTLDAWSYCRDLQYADLNGDGAGELVCLVQTSTSADSGGLIVLKADDLTVLWQFPANDYGQSIAIGNVDGDSALEIVTSAGYVFDGATFANEWAYGPGFGFDVDTGDLDGDGIDEIVGAVDWTAVRAYSATLKSPLWEIATGDLDSLLVTNIDGDAAAEILVGDGQSGNVTAYKYNAVSNSADVVFQINSQDSGVTDLGVGDVDHDGELEFIWGSGASSSGADALVIAGRNPAIEVEWTNADPRQLDGPFVGGELAASLSKPPAPLFATASTNSSYDGTRLISMDPVSGDLGISEELGSNWTGWAPLAVTDYDGDGTDEAFLATADAYDAYLTAYDPFGAVTEWTSQPLTNRQVFVSVANADVTNDGKDDLIALTAAGVVYVYDVFAQTLVWQSTTLGSGVKVAVADLDHDGVPEIVVATTDYIYVYARTSGPTAYIQAGYYAVAPVVVRDMLVADTDGDGELEIVALVGDSDYFDTAAEVVRLDRNLAVLSQFAIDWRADTIAVEASSWPRKNLILPTANARVGIPAEIVALDAVSGAEVWRSPALLGQVSPNSLHFVDPAGDGKLRISFGTRAGMYLTQ